MSENGVQGWLRGKGGLVGPLAVQAATMGVDVYIGLLDWAREGEVVPGREDRPGADPVAWARLYRRHKHVRRVVMESIPVFGADSGLSWEDFEGLAEVLTLAANQPAAFQAVAAGAAKELQGKAKADKAAGGGGLLADVMPEEWSLAQALAGWWTDTGQDQPAKVPGEDGMMRAAFERPEVLFFFKVWLPCWFEYGQFAPVLMRQARLWRADRLLTPEERLAKLDAAGKLLRLDKGALCEPGIAAVFRDASAGGGAILGDLWKDYRGQPVGKLERGRVKALLAGLVVQLSDLAHSLLPKVLAVMPEGYRAKVRELVGEKIGPADMRRLYDAVAVDAGRGGPAGIDGDISPDPDNWYMAVYRGKKQFWSYLTNPYKKLLGGV